MDNMRKKIFVSEKDVWKEKEKEDLRMRVEKIYFMEKGESREWECE
jgi:hypothetical protein